MTRVIHPIGKVSAALGRHGYRQQAIILIDNEPLPHVAILSIKLGGRTKFEGHWIDPNGELHKTNAFVDMKKAATAILAKRERALAAGLASEQAVAKPAAKTAAAKRAARRQQRHSSTPTAQSAGAMIECRGCGKRHADDTLCPED